MIYEEDIFEKEPCVSCESRWINVMDGGYWYCTKYGFDIEDCVKIRKSKNKIENLGSSNEVRPIDANALIREMKEMGVNYIELLLVERQPTLEIKENNK